MRRWLHHVLGRNLAFKALSLALALLLFVLVHQEKRTLAHGLINLSYTLPPGKALVTPAPSTLSVGITGPASRMRRFRFDEVPAVAINLAGVGEGYFGFREKMLGLPEGFKVSFINPEGFQVRFAPVVHRVLPVKVIIQGEVAKGYWVKKRGSNPAEISISGPERLLSPIKELRTEPVGVDGATATISQLTDLAALPPGIRIDAAPSTRVTIEIAPITTEVVIPGVLVVVDDALNRRRRPLQRTVKIVVSGAPENLTHLSQLKLTAHLKCDREHPGRVKLRPVIEGLPSHLYLQRIFPFEVEVVIEGAAEKKGSGRPPGKQ
jgi:YbbR domain-containing protein